MGIIAGANAWQRLPRMCAPPASKAHGNADAPCRRTIGTLKAKTLAIWTKKGVAPRAGALGNSLVDYGAAIGPAWQAAAGGRKIGNGGLPGDQNLSASAAPPFDPLTAQTYSMW